MPTAAAEPISLLQAFLLALVQGITEFLPISSSAHLILTPYLFDWPDQGLVFDVATNTGTLLAVVLYFRRDLLGLARGVVSGERVEGMPPWRLLAALFVGTIPVAVAGLLLYDFIAGEARNPVLIAATSIGFGLLLWAADLIGRRRRELATLTVWDGLWIGLAQAAALVPGTSRSGITMTFALFLGFTRPAAARFSFLLAIPVGVLAAAKDGLDLLGGEAPAVGWLPLLVGFAVSAVSAYLVIGWLLAWLERQTMAVFVAYRVLLGLVILGLVYGLGYGV